MGLGTINYHRRQRAAIAAAPVAPVQKPRDPLLVAQEENAALRACVTTQEARIAELTALLEKATEPEKPRGDQFGTQILPVQTPRSSRGR